MEVIEIGKTQLIFVLDRGDMKKYRIDADCKTPILKDGFSRLVTDLGVGSQFLSGVLVQIFDSKNGGCEMFVTKIPDSTSLSVDGTPTDKKYIYIFSALDELLSACKMLSGANVQGGIAYADTDKKKYFLLLSKECQYMGEFGGLRCKESVWEYLSEHCSLICECAIETLSVLA